MFALSICLECFVLITVLAAPTYFDESEEYGFPDYDPFAHLEQIGNKIFGYPKESTGR